MPEPRSAGEWAKACDHLACPSSQGDGLCLDCARAYAQEVGEAVREQAAQTATSTTMEDLPLGRSPLDAKYAVDQAVEKIAVALRQIEVPTP